jgi:hypothetical protein
MGYPVWNRLGIEPFLKAGLIKAVPDILSATELNFYLY